MKHSFAICALFICLSYFMVSSCNDPASSKIKTSLTNHFANDNVHVMELRSLVIDSIIYNLADSTAYYNHFLNSLADQSESYSKMARLRTNLAQAHLNNFLSGDKDENIQPGKTKQDVDKSLDDLQQNERAWDKINDSMDLMLNAVHTTDTMKKVFYEVNFLLKGADKEMKTVHKKAILNKNDFSVVFVD